MYTKSLYKVLVHKLLFADLLSDLVKLNEGSLYVKITDHDELYCRLVWYGYKKQEIIDAIKYYTSYFEIK